MANSNLLGIILAAGKGTRMKSDLPKVLHKLGGKPMLQYVLEALEGVKAHKKIVVTGFGSQAVEEFFKNRAEFILQKEQLGTGHAVKMAKEEIKAFDGTIMVLCGDTPLLESGLLAKLYESHKESKAEATVLTAILPDPTGYGRLIKGKDGYVTKIVEQKDATPEELLTKEINTGIYCFEKDALLMALDSLTRENSQGEYYLTDVVGVLEDKGLKVWAMVTENAVDVMGVNSRVQLAQAGKVLRMRKLTELMESGVTIIDPDSTFIDMDATIEKETVIYPFTMIEGKTKIGAHCQIGPNTRIQNSSLGNNVVMHFSYAHDAEISDDVTLGPYVHLRPDTKLAKGVKIGNFVEVKNSTVGENSKIPHLSYIGDTDMGGKINIGSGTITVNYNGVSKHRTIIEEGAFIGCNTNLVAPVKVGKNSYIAAGSTITEDVPPDSLGIARGRQNNVLGWKKNFDK